MSTALVEYALVEYDREVTIATVLFKTFHDPDSRTFDEASNDIKILLDKNEEPSAMQVITRQMYTLLKMYAKTKDAVHIAKAQNLEIDYMEKVKLHKQRAVFEFEQKKQYQKQEFKERELAHAIKAYEFEERKKSCQTQGQKRSRPRQPRVDPVDIDGDEEHSDGDQGYSCKRKKKPTVHLVSVVTKTTQEGIENQLTKLSAAHLKAEFTFHGISPIFKGKKCDVAAHLAQKIVAQQKTVKDPVERVFGNPY